MNKTRFWLACIIFCLTSIGYAETYSSFTAQTPSDYFPLIPPSYRGAPYFSVPSAARTRAKTLEDTIVEGVNNLQPEIDIRTYRIPNTDIAKLYFAMLYRHPELFWAATYARWSVSFNGITQTLCPQYTVSDKTELAALKARFNATVEDAVATAGQAVSDIERALLLHDWLALHCRYDYQHENPNMATSYGALVDGLAVCQGYTLAYTMLLSKVGILSECVSSDELNHAWNMVTIDGEKYHVDVTWDDGDDKRDLSSVEHVYFLLNDEAIKKPAPYHLQGHTGWNNETDFSSSSERFNNYFWRSSDIQNTALPCISGVAFAFDDRTLKKYRLTDGVCLNDNCLNVGYNSYPCICLYNNMLVYNNSSQLAVYNPLTDSSQTIPFTFDNNLGQIISLYPLGNSQPLQAIIATGTYNTLFSYKDIPWTHVTDITLNHSSLSISSTTTQLKLQATLSPADCTCSDISWSSSKPDVATVDSDGSLTLQGLGQTVIIATTADGGLTASCNLTVTRPPKNVTLTVKTAALLQNSITDSGTLSYGPNWGTATGGGITDTNTEVTLTAYPQNGYAVAYWLDTLNLMPFGLEAPNVTVNPQNNTTYIAVFKRSPCSYHAVSAFPQYGYVSPDEPADTLFEGTGTFTAVPYSGCVFLGWVDPDNNDAIVSTLPEWSTSITQDGKVFRAIFAPQNDDKRLLTHIDIQTFNQAQMTTEVPMLQDLSVVVTAYFHDGSSKIIDFPELLLDDEGRRFATLENAILTNANDTRDCHVAQITTSYSDKTITRTASCTITLQGIPDECLTLKPGWNLTAFCAIPTAESLAAIQQTITLQTFNNSCKIWTAAASVSLHKGYVVYNSSGNDLELPFTARTNTADELTLQYGWNFIGISQTLPDNASFRTRDDLTFWSLDSTGKFIRVCPDQIQKGQGYLVYRSPGF